MKKLKSEIHKRTFCEVVTKIKKSERNIDKNKLSENSDYYQKDSENIASKVSVWYNLFKDDRTFTREKDILIMDRKG